VEWRAPALFETQFLPFWLLLVVCLASLIFSRRSRDATHVAILGLILSQALQHHRHTAFFVLACGWWLPAHFDSLLARLGIGRRVATTEETPASDSCDSFAAKFPRRMQWAFAGLLSVAVLLSAGRLLARVTTLKVERDVYPVDAFDFIARRGLSGKMVCTFNWAQYALAAFGPHEPGEEGILVQID